MDVFVEQMVVKPQKGKDYALKFLIALAAVVLSAFFVLILAIMAFIPVVGIVYAAYYLISGLDCEYEYIVTNGEIDIDKIAGKRKRTRLITADARKFTAFGKLENAGKLPDKATVVDATDGSGTAFYADFVHGKLGETRLIFSPNEKVLEAVKPFIPRMIKREF